MTMKNPPHPGLSVRHDCIEPLGLTITDAAEILDVTRQTLNNLVNCKSGISADMTIRFGYELVGECLSRNLISFRDTGYCGLTERGVKLLSATDGLNVGPNMP